MVGKTQSLNMHKAKKRTPNHSPHLKQTPGGHGNGHNPKQHIPFIASPLDPKATAWIHSKHEAGNLTLKRRPTIAQFEADRVAGGIFRKQHEASTLELFFDLFFVANLAIFTTNHQHESPLSVANYIGFFAILWSTWFQISIFDVRFYVDSVLNRFFKLVIFGIFTTFTGLGPIYDVIINGGTSRAFHGIALVLMVSRLVLLIQYATVLWFVKSFKKTLLPLSLMMLVYLCTSMAFLATYLDGVSVPTGQWDGLKHVVVWYGVIAIEAILVIVISSTWRILSFKHTHLVERVGLLTLIIMGEGIIGLTKSTAYMLSGTNISVWSNLGSIVASVTLIYAVYILYFSPIDHDRFGTIRQQIWTLCHFPLHVTLLLTEEGSAVTLLWDQCNRARMQFMMLVPTVASPAGTYNSTTAWINGINKTMSDTATKYHYVKLKDVYDYSADLYKVKNISDAFGSKGWNDKVSPIVDDIITSTSNFFFQNFNFEKPKKLYSEKDNHKKLQIYYDAYLVSFTFFYIGAGCLLLLLGAMYWIGKNNKTREEWSGIMVRLAFGLALPFVTMTAWLNRTETSFRFVHCSFIIPIVTFVFLAVVMLDNIIYWIGDLKNHRRNTFTDDSEEGVELEKQNHHHLGKDNDGKPTMLDTNNAAVTMTTAYQPYHRDEETVEIDDEHQRLVSHQFQDQSQPGIIYTDTSYSSHPHQPCSAQYQNNNNDSPNLHPQQSEYDITQGGGQNRYDHPNYNQNSNQAYNGQDYDTSTNIDTRIDEPPKLHQVVFNEPTMVSPINVNTARAPKGYHALGS